MYQQNTQSQIGSLLRTLYEGKSQSPIAMPPGSETAAPIRETVQTPVMNPESPGTARNVSLPAEGAGLPGAAPTGGTLTPSPSIVGFGGKGGGLGVNTYMGTDQSGNPSFNIPEQKQGPMPTSTPPSAMSTIPITTQGAPPPKSFIQTPGVAMGTKIISQPIPISNVSGQNRAETIVSFAQKEFDALSGLAQPNSGVDFTTQEGQNALDRLDKLQAQLEPLAQTAPAYLKQNVDTLLNNVGVLKNVAVERQSEAFRQVPQWAEGGLREKGQGIVNDINTAVAEKQKYEQWKAEQERNRNNGNGNNGDQGQPSVGNPPPEASPAPTSGQVFGANTITNRSYVPAPNTSTKYGAVYTPPPLSTNIANMPGPGTDASEAQFERQMAALKSQQAENLKNLVKALEDAGFIGAARKIKQLEP